MKKLIEMIINDNSISGEEKSILIERIVKATHKIDMFVVPGFYLHTEISKETDEVEIELWYRNIDEDGTCYHGPTNYDNETILKFLKKGCLNINSKSK